MITSALVSIQGQNLTRFIHKRTKTAEEATEERLEKEADKGVKREVNKALNKLFGAQEESSDSAAASTGNAPGQTNPSSQNMDMNALMGSMGISSGEVNTKPVYEFDGLIEMEITNYEKDDPVENTTYTTYVDSKSLDYGMAFNEPGSADKSFIIFDTENDLMLTLAESDGEKTGFAISFTPEQAEAIAEEMEEEDTEETVTSVEEVTDPYAAYRTGKTKKILGYKCDEYRIEEEDQDEVVTMWITQDLSKDIKKSYLRNSTFTGMFMYAYYTNGMVMEYILEDTADDTRTVMTVTDIDLNRKNSVSTQGYTIMNMAGMMDAQGDEQEDLPAEDE